MTSEAVNKKGNKVLFSSRPSEESTFLLPRAPVWYFKRMFQQRANRFQIFLFFIILFGFSAIAVVSNNFDEAYDGISEAVHWESHMKNSAQQNARGRISGISSTSSSATTTSLIHPMKTQMGKKKSRTAATLGETYSNEMEQSMDKLNKVGTGASKHDHPMLVHNGRLGVTTGKDSFDDFEKHLGQIVTANEGYFERKSNDGSRTNYQSMTASIRVPSPKFDLIVKEIRQLTSVVRINHYSTETKDVTDEYIDSSARADVLEASRSSLQSLLQKADKIEDILMLQNHLNRLTEQAESLRQRAMNLKKDSEYSTLVLEVYSVSRYNNDDESNNDMVSPYQVIIIASGHVYNCIVTIFNIFVYMLVWLVPFTLFWYIITGLCFGKSEAPSSLPTSSSLGA